MSSAQRPWIRKDDRPRRAGVSSFGFGGSNFHIALEEYTGSTQPADLLRTQGPELFTLAGESATALVRTAEALLERARAGVPYSILGRDSHANARGEHRLTMVVDSDVALVKELEAALAKLEDPTPATFSTPKGTCYGHGPVQGKVAFVFPGQGISHKLVDAGVNLEEYGECSICVVNFEHHC